MEKSKRTVCDSAHAASGLVKQVAVNKICPICLDPTKCDEQLCVCGACSRSYHMKCIGQWLMTDRRSSCPNCRTIIELPKSIAAKIVRSGEEVQQTAGVGTSRITPAPPPAFPMTASRPRPATNIFTPKMYSDNVHMSFFKL